MQDIIRYCVIPYFDKYVDSCNIGGLLYKTKNVKINVFKNVPDFPPKFRIKNLIINNYNLTYKITDNECKYLKGIHTLDLYMNTNITDNGLKHLKGIHTLNLALNTNITDIGLLHLKGIHTLFLYLNENITDDGLQHIKNCILTNSKLQYYNKKID